MHSIASCPPRFLSVNKARNLSVNDLTKKEKTIVINTNRYTYQTLVLKDYNPVIFFLTSSLKLAEIWFDLSWDNHSTKTADHHMQTFHKCCSQNVPVLIRELKSYLLYTWRIYHGLNKRP